MCIARVLSIIIIFYWCVASVLECIDNCYQWAGGIDKKKTVCRVVDAPYAIRSINNYFISWVQIINPYATMKIFGKLGISSRPSRGKNSMPPRRRSNKGNTEPKTKRFHKPRSHRRRRRKVCFWIFHDDFKR